MKFGIRTPSLKGRLSARTSLKRMVRAKVRAPRGMGLLTNPKKAVYNRVYNRTSMSVDQLAHKGLRGSKNTGSTTAGLKILGYIFLFFVSIAFWPIGVLVVLYLIYKYFFKAKKNESLIIEAGVPAQTSASHPEPQSTQTLPPQSEAPETVQQ